MNIEYEDLEDILKELDELEKARKYIDKLNLRDIPVYKDNNLIGKKFKMLTVLDKSDKRTKNRRGII